MMDENYSDSVCKHREQVTKGRNITIIILLSLHFDKLGLLQTSS